MISPSFSRRRPRRDVNSILERAHKRWSSDEHVLPPDFLHGSWQVGEASHWLDGVTRHVAHTVGEGHLFVITSVTSSAGFIQVHQRVVTELTECAIDLHVVESGSNDNAWTFSRVEALELEHLGALRDTDRDLASIESVKTNAFLDTLSLIGLHTLHLDAIGAFRFAA